MPSLIIAAMLSLGGSQAEVVSVYDGDTIRIVSPETGEIERVRLMGFDTAERKGAQCRAESDLAERQRQALVDLIGNVVRVDIQGKDRYGRTLAWVYTADGRAVSDIMIERHGARPYQGGKRQSWCN